MVRLLRSDRAEVAGRGSHGALTTVRRLLIRAGDFFFKYRDVIAPLVFLTLVLTTRPALAFGSARGDLLLDAAGILLLVVAQVLRAAVIGYAYIIRGGKNKQVYAETLVRAGFFAHSRNPLYLGNLLGILGLLIIHNSSWAYLIGIPFALFLYLTIVLAEEHYLTAKFGVAYDQYRQQVPRFIPKLRGLPKTLKGMRFNWNRLIAKEYGTTFNGGTMIVLLLAWESYWNLSDARGIGRLEILGLAQMVLIVAYGLARYLKKSKMLRT